MLESMQSECEYNKGLVRVYADRQTDITQSSQLVTVIIYIYMYILYGVSDDISGCYKHRGKLNLSCSGYNYCQYFVLINKLRSIRSHSDLFLLLISKMAVFDTHDRYYNNKETKSADLIA